jgi:transglutaminase-like putative cysteine protease
MFAARKILFLLVPFFLCTTMIYAQDAPVQWKKIPVEDLQLTSYSADTAASALILCDYGVTSFDDDLNLVFDRHLRVKIFNENGYYFGDHVIRLFDEYDKLDDIEAYTYWINEKGKVQSLEFDDDDLRKEQASEDFIEYKFAMPGLKPGCILEIKYRIITDHIGLVRDWTFQYSEPVRWSEYRVMHLANFAYSSISRGYELFYINEVTPTTKVVAAAAQSYTGKPIANCNMMRYVLKDAPAVRKESYMACPDDYKNKVEIQLAQYALRGGGVKKLGNNWPDFVKDLHESKWFGKRIEVSGSVKKIASEITAGLTEPEEKVKALYNWVSQSIVWDKDERMYPGLKMDEVISQKKGNSADINLLLVSLLRSAGIESDPFILSTRSNGRIQDLYPIRYQFNYVVARAKVNSKSIFLDATNPLRPYDLLSSNLLYVKALAVKEGPLEWTSLGSSKKNTTVNFASIKLNGDGAVSGYLENKWGEYSSLRIRNRLSGSNEKEVISNMLETEYYGFSIDSVMIKGKDELDKSVETTAYVNSDEYAQNTGDLIYFNPHIVYRLKENPFKAEVRKFPVEYGYHNSSVNTINITIPDGYEIKETLKNKNIFAGAANISYSRKVISEGNNLQITCKFDIKEVEVKPNLYPKLREFYSQVLAAESEQIVLAKKSSGTGG